MTRTCVLALLIATSCGGGQVHDFDASTTYTLAVTVQGPGTVAGPGIACGVDCSEMLDAGTMVTLTATPAGGGTFTGWSGDCAGAGACLVTMSAARNVTATFAGSRGMTIIVGPSDCSAAAVNQVIAAASDGDTVQLTCTGEVTWTEAVTIPSSKGIVLSGGGTNTPKTSAMFPLAVTSLQSPAVAIVVGLGNSPSRLTGFLFRNPGTTAGDGGFVNVTGQGVGVAGGGAFRIDNNYLDKISGHTIVGILSKGGPLYGLVDNNTMHNAWRADSVDYGPYGVQVWNDFHGQDGCWGETGWTDPFSFGDGNFVFVEDNLFENVTTGYYVRHYISAELGGRYVARYNTFDVEVASPGGNQTDAIEAHGFCICGSNGMGARGGEIYDNAFSGAQLGRPIMPRGGTWMIYDNSFDTIGSWGQPVWLMEYRAGDAGMYAVQHFLPVHLDLVLLGERRVALSARAAGRRHVLVEQPVRRRESRRRRRRSRRAGCVYPTWTRLLRLAHQTRVAHVLAVCLSAPAAVVLAARLGEHGTQHRDRALEPDFVRGQSAGRRELGDIRVVRRRRRIGRGDLGAELRPAGIHTRARSRIARRGVRTLRPRARRRTFARTPARPRESA
jgi:hypothetical protein